MTSASLRKREPERISASGAWAHRQRSDYAALRHRRDEKPDAGRVIENRDVEPDRLAGQHLHHQARGSGPATRRASDLVMVRLIAQNAAKSVLGYWQPHEL